MTAQTFKNSFKTFFNIWIQNQYTLSRTAKVNGSSNENFSANFQNSVDKCFLLCYNII